MGTGTRVEHDLIYQGRFYRLRVVFNPRCSMNINTADLAREAIALSTQRHITREAALKVVFRTVPFEKQSWETPNDVCEKREILFQLVLSLIPHFEPSKINAHFTGQVRNQRQRLARMRKEQQKNRKVHFPFLHPQRPSP
ncbi:MAG: hypothetical protein UY50_C0011G0006 [Parcubacteria group bacterium GW2011_GWA2_49_9]|nr:MAG: hypothetical protein UY50_C0011G0006 [Parcubacteria group bacterium GW2011_GWA2_49_9]